MVALLHPRTRTWTRTRTTRHTPAELLLLPHPPETLHDDDIVVVAAADDEVVVAEEKQADVVVVANVVVEGTSVEVQVYVRRDVVADQFAVAVVEVDVVVVVDGGQRWRLRHLPCTIDVTVLGACPPPGVAVHFSFPPHSFLHCALIWVVVCSWHLDLVFVCLLKKTQTNVDMNIFLVGNILF